MFARVLPNSASICLPFEPVMTVRPSMTMALFVRYGVLAKPDPFLRNAGRVAKLDGPAAKGGSVNNL